MNLDEATSIVVSVISSVQKNDTAISLESPLVGNGALLDSMQLVELCLSLEDTAEEHEFEFDWASGATMSRSSSIFRSVETLCAEFHRQSEK